MSLGSGEPGIPVGPEHGTRGPGCASDVPLTSPRIHESVKKAHCRKLRGPSVRIKAPNRGRSRDSRPESNAEMVGEGRTKRESLSHPAPGPCGFDNVAGRRGLRKIPSNAETGETGRGKEKGAIMSEAGAFGASGAGRSPGAHATPCGCQGQEACDPEESEKTAAAMRSATASAHVAQAAVARAELHGAEASPAPQAGRPGAPLRILFLEDREDDVFLASRELRRSGVDHQLLRVETREDFVAALGDFGPDIILADYGLPAFDGMSALVLAQDLQPATPLIMVTGSLNEEIAVECMKAGAADYVLKERNARLAPSVTAALDRAKVRRAKEAAEAELLVQAEELRATNRELAHFVFVASHDLREPVRKIEVLADRLETRCGATLDAQASDHLARLRSSAARLRHQVDDLLQYARITGGSEHFEEVDLGQIVDQALEELEDMFVDARSEVELGPLGKVYGDALQLRGAIRNLLHNALKFRKADQPCRVLVESEERGEEVVLTISDNGIGFTQEHLDDIFLPFHQLHQQCAGFEGTGLGLAICQRIAHRHHGSISARSHPGRGSVFQLLLPRTKSRLQRNDPQRAKLRTGD